MNPFKLLLPIAILLTFSAKSQDTIKYAHCNCTDVIDTLSPIPSGAYRRTRNNVLIEQGQFIMGLKTGEWISYNTAGILIKKISYLDGKLNGAVSFYYNNGNKKLSGSFLNGMKVGDWEFYNEDEKVQWSQTFTEGIPTGKMLVYDPKGKKVVVSYDHDKKVYDINKEGFSLLESAEGVLQDPTSSEWFFIFIANPTPKTAEMLLNQENIESELLTSLLEIPSEIFYTYINVNYDVEMTFERFALKSVELTRDLSDHEDYPLFGFLAVTDFPEKLRTVDYSELTMTLLDSKIKEAISIFPPWTIENGTFKMSFLYTVNKVEGRQLSVEK